MFDKLLMTSVGPLIRLSLVTSLLQRKTRLLALTEFPTVPTGVLGVWARNSSLMLAESLLEGVAVPEHFAESRTVFIPQTSDIDDNGRIIRSPDALRPLT